MATTPTSNPIPSEEPRDLAFNAGKFDEYVNSANPTYTDRFGVERWTISGQSVSNQAEFDASLVTQRDDFEAAQLNQQNVFNEHLSDFDENAQSALLAVGFIPFGTFSAGATLTTISQALYHAATNTYYSWNGTFPKTVAPSSTPIGESGWLIAGNGPLQHAGSIALFGQVIDTNQTIPSGMNALSISPSIADGITVTVPDGAKYVIL